MLKEPDASAGEQVSEPLLERRIDLTAIPVQSVAWVVVFLIAAGIRLHGRTNWPLSDGESAIARDAWALTQGLDLSTSADSYPIIVQLTAFAFFLFGDTDFTARLIPLLAGLGILVTLFWLRSWFGNLPSLSIAIIWAISPVMTMSSMRIEGAMLLVLSSLLTLVLTMTMHVNPDSRKAILLGAAIAVGLTSDPLAWIVLSFTLIPAMILTRDFRLGGQLVQVTISFLVTTLVITTWFGSRISAVPEFFRESLTVLWNTHLNGLGNDWQATPVVLLADEPLLLFMCLVGLAVIVSRADWNISAHPAIFISCAAWATPLLTLGLILDGKAPALYAATLFPLMIVAGLGLSMLLDGVASIGWQRGYPVIWGTVFLALIVAIVRFADTIARGPETDLIAWLVSAVAIGLLILLPLGFLIIRLSVGTGWTLVPVAILIVVMITGGVGLRTSLLLSDTSEDRPGELLHAGGSTPAVGRIEHRLRTYSRDVTSAVQDARDPTASHGLMIVIEDELSGPFSWYFRDFPNLLIVQGPDDIPEDIAPDIVLTSEAREQEWSDVLDRHQSRTYQYRYADASSVPSSAYNGLLVSAINPIEYRSLFTFSIYRDHPELLQREEMTLTLRSDHAERVWGVTQ